MAGAAANEGSAQSIATIATEVASGDTSTAPIMQSATAQNEMVDNKQPDDKNVSQDDDNADEIEYGSEWLQSWPHPINAKCICAEWPADEDFDIFARCLEDAAAELGMNLYDLREYYDKLWEHRECVPLNGFESSFLDGCKAYSSLYGWKVDYDHCTPQQLKQFVRERGLRDPYPAGVTLKYFYIRVLEKADAEVEYDFRFMDLPPEIRVMVYEELLTLRSTETGKESGHPAILSTCQQVFKEAGDILYASNVVVAEACVEKQQAGTFARTAIVHNDDRKFGCGHPRFARLPAGIDDIPSFMRRIRHLEICLKYKGPRADLAVSGNTFIFNHFVYSLASFLMEGHSLERLIVNVNIGDGGEDDQYNYDAALYPLRRLRNVPDVVFKGHVPPKLRTKLNVDLKSSEPIFNTLRFWKLLMDETAAQMQLYRALGITACECGECGYPDDFEELEYVTDAICDAWPESVRNSRREENFIARLSRLKKALRNNSARARLEEMIEESINAREATASYETTTDDGRLKEAEGIWDGRITDFEMWDWGDDLPSDMELDNHEWSDTEPDPLGEEFEIVASAEQQQTLDYDGTAQALKVLDSDAEDEGSLVSFAGPVARRTRASLADL